MQRFKNVLVSVDARSDVHPALEWAIPLVERNQARVTFIDVLPDFPWYIRAAVRDHDLIRELLIKEKSEQLSPARDIGNGLDMYRMDKKERSRYPTQPSRNSAKSCEGVNKYSAKEVKKEISCVVRLRI